MPHRAIRETFMRHKHKTPIKSAKNSSLLHYYHFPFSSYEYELWKKRIYVSSKINITLSNCFHFSWKIDTQTNGRRRRIHHFLPAPSEWNHLKAGEWQMKGNAEP